MRDITSRVLAGLTSGFVMVGVGAVLVSMATRQSSSISGPAPVSVTTVVPSEPSTGAEWLAEMRPYCNPVDVTTRMGWNPAPPSVDGEMHRAACLALAGRFDEARSVLEGLPEEERWSNTILRFAIKEAIYKAIDPFVQRFVGFDEVSVFPRPDGTAEIRLHLKEEPRRLEVESCWIYRDRNWIATARARRS